MASGTAPARAPVPAEGAILLLSQDVIGPQMAGPGIRAYHLARILSREFPVRLAIPDAQAAVGLAESFEVVGYQPKNWASLAPQVAQARVVIFPSDLANDFPLLAQSAAALVVDGYDPLLAEWLALVQALPLDEQQVHWVNRLNTLNPQYLLGDFYLCASERQRDWWLGVLEASGRINPYTYAADPSLRRLVDVVPYGLAAEAPRPGHAVIKAVWPGIEADDRLVLWGGGLWSWLDPFTAIQAIARLRERLPQVRLVFPGTQHPNPLMAGMTTHAAAARQLAEQLGLLGRHVFFGDWVAYADWPAVLLESDLALTLHAADTYETRLAFRSRVLDYIWADLPTVASQGDVTNDVLERYGLGRVVPPGNVEAVATAMLTLLTESRESRRPRFEQARQALTWERAAQPLLDFCRHPQHAADKAAFGARLGNPFYHSRLAHLENEIARLQLQVEAYERMKFVRLVRWLHPYRQQWRRLFSRDRG